MSVARAVLWISAASGVLNGLWMLVFPEHWYYNLPADVPAYGPLNLHFVRDVGAAFFGSGAALGWAALSPLSRKSWLIAGTFFVMAHALLHLAGAVSGHASHDMLKKEILLVYVPALALLIAAVKILKTKT